MDLISMANAKLLLAGGSIPGDNKLGVEQQWGVTLAGLGIVLAALLLLVFIIWLFGRIFDGLNTVDRNKATKKAAANAPKASPSPLRTPAPAAPKAAPAPAPAVPESDDDEVIAVISAVVAMMSAQDGTTYQVKSVKPVQNGFTGRTAWAMDGRRSNVSPF